MITVIMNNANQLFQKYRRLIILISILACLYIIGKVTGLANWEIGTIHSYVKKAGVWGYGIYIFIFCAGEFIHLPGMIFVGAGILAYGKVTGFFLAFMGSMASVCFSFVTVRAIGGKALRQIERPFFRKMLARLDDNPIRIVIVLRLILWLAPPLNYTLALSNICFRDYIIGSAIGLILPVGLASIFFEWMFIR